MRRQSEFAGLPTAIVGGGPTDRQSLAIEKALHAKAIRIRNIDMASRRIVADYPEIAGWYCLSVRQRAEFAVEKDLLAADIIACVPRRKGEVKRHRHGGETAPILPVIPGYILVRCVPSAAAFAGLRGIDRVTGIVGRGEVPYRVPVKMIEHFIRLADDGAYDFRPAEHGFVVGERVRVCDGPFASFYADVIDIEKTATEGRINVEVNIFGRLARTEMDVAQIEKL